jgi:hypothetical protein
MLKKKKMERGEEKWRDVKINLKEEKNGEKTRLTRRFSDSRHRYPLPKRIEGVVGGGGL